LRVTGYRLQVAGYRLGVRTLERFLNIQLATCNPQPVTCNPLQEWTLSQVRRHILACSGFADLGMFQEAVRELEELPESIRNSTPVLVAWLELYQRWEKWSEALAVAECLVAREPADPNWAVAFAFATRRAVNLEAALRILQEAVLNFPGCATIHFNLACYHAQLNRLEEAARYLDEACKLDPEFRAAAQTDPDLVALRDTNLL
jgi:tetratricopeptide (TPR) repeat protein